MFEIKVLNKIAKIGTDRLGDNFRFDAEVENPDGILVRSASMLEMELPKNLKGIARAGAGVNNIPIDRCSEAGIAVFNTPGANANAVKELAVCALLISSRKITAGINWALGLENNPDAAALIEKGKSQFVGPELYGKKLGVIGLGAIGVLVANAAHGLGMEVYGYDPFLSVDAAWKLSRSIKHAKDIKEIFAECDYISVHVPLMPATKGLINAEAIAQMKDGVRIINLARGGLVDNTAILPALESGKVAAYVTDFPDAEVIGKTGVIAIPHLGASTPESEDNCAMMACDELREFLTEGIIRNSVNLPNVEEPLAFDSRMLVIHRNIPNMVSAITKVLAEKGMNIENMVNKSKKDYAVTVIDFDGKADADITDIVAKVEGVLSVRVIEK